MDLQAIKARCAAATKGPWSVQLTRPYNENTGISCDGGINLGRMDTEENAEFCAHAREDVPALVAEVERLKADYDCLNDFEKTQCCKLLARVGVLQEQLAAAVKDMRDNAHNSCRVCGHYQKHRRCDLEETIGHKDCAGFNRWVWRGPQEGEHENERQKTSSI